jgi:hypothetical protein
MFPSLVKLPHFTIRWDDCGKTCNHATHRISYEKLIGWSAPHKPIHSSIVTENNSKYGRRIILVYKPSKKDVATSSETAVTVE